MLAGKTKCHRLYNNTQEVRNNSCRKMSWPPSKKCATAERETFLGRIKIIGVSFSCLKKGNGSFMSFPTGNFWKCDAAPSPKSHGGFEHQLFFEEYKSKIWWKFCQYRKFIDVLTTCQVIATATRQQRWSSCYPVTLRWNGKGVRVQVDV